MRSEIRDLIVSQFLFYALLSMAVGFRVGIDFIPIFESNLAKWMEETSSFIFDANSVGSFPSWYVIT